MMPTAGAYLAGVAIPSLPPADFLMRRIDGRLERAIEPRSAGMIARLLSGLLTAADGGAVDVRQLAVAVHDRLVAHIYLAELGERVRARSRCRACGEVFELDFLLPDLIAGQDSDAAKIGLPDENGFWTTPDGLRLRPPTIADAEAENATGLLARITDVPPPDSQDVGAFLESASPTMSLDIDADCPACGDKQAVWFDLPRFLLEALAAERPFLLRETHLIAARYGWSHETIMALPRDERRAFAALIESERSAALRQAS